MTWDGINPADDIAVMRFLGRQGVDVDAGALQPEDLHRPCQRVRAKPFSMAERVRMNVQHAARRCPDLHSRHD